LSLARRAMTALGMVGLSFVASGCNADRHAKAVYFSADTAIELQDTRALQGLIRVVRNELGSSRELSLPLTDSVLRQLKSEGALELIWPREVRLGTAVDKRVRAWRILVVLDHKVPARPGGKVVILTGAPTYRSPGYIVPDADSVRQLVADIVNREVKRPRRNAD
jgi:hypothetical protein